MLFSSGSEAIIILWHSSHHVIFESMRRELYDHSAGAFRDGVGINHTAMLSTNLA